MKIHVKNLYASLVYGFLKALVKIIIVTMNQTSQLVFPENILKYCRKI